MGLIQREPGRLLGISEQAIQHWERGVRSPKPEHLKRLLAPCLQRNAFAQSREHEEAEQLWLAAGQQADLADRHLCAGLWGAARHPRLPMETARAKVGDDVMQNENVISCL